MSTEKVVVLKSQEEIVIRKNAADITVYVYELKKKPSVITLKKGAVLAMALDKAEIPADEDVDQSDIRVNAKQAKLLQVLNDGDSIFIPSKVEGA
jgi:hypothetical protein